MIQKLLELQKKKQQRKLSSSGFDQKKQSQYDNVKQTKKVSVNDLCTIIQYQTLSDREESGSENYNGKAPAPHTDRATFNRNLMLLRTRNKKLYHFKKNNYTNSELSHNFTGKKVNQISQKMLPIQLNTQNCFFITRNPQSLLSHKKCSLSPDHNLSSMLPKCSKVHKISSLQKDLTRQNTSQDQQTTTMEHCRRRTCSGYLSTITRKKNIKQKKMIQVQKSALKIDLREYRLKNEENWLSESIDISPWKYGHSRFHTDNT